MIPASGWRLLASRAFSLLVLSLPALACSWSSLVPIILISISTRNAPREALHLPEPGLTRCGDLKFRWFFGWFFRWFFRWIHLAQHASYLSTSLHSHHLADLSPHISVYIASDRASSCFRRQLLRVASDRRACKRRATEKSIWEEHLRRASERGTTTEKNIWVELLKGNLWGELQEKNFWERNFASERFWPEVQENLFWRRWTRPVIYSCRKMAFSNWNSVFQLPDRRTHAANSSACYRRHSLCLPFVDCS